MRHPQNGAERTDVTRRPAKLISRNGIGARYIAVRAFFCKLLFAGAIPTTHRNGTYGTPPSLQRR
jgi:hypothetical protein